MSPKKKPNTFYKVRIDNDLRLDFMETVPWGSQGKVIEAFMEMFFEEVQKHGPTLATAKLTDKRYELMER